MSAITDRIAIIRAMEDWMGAAPPYGRDVMAAGELLRDALAGVDPETGMRGVSDWDIDTRRAERGESLLPTLDATYQTRDWEQAAGRADLKRDDFYDS